MGRPKSEYRHFMSSAPKRNRKFSAVFTSSSAPAPAPLPSTVATPHTTLERITYPPSRQHEPRRTVLHLSPFLRQRQQICGLTRRQTNATREILSSDCAISMPPAAALMKKLWYWVNWHEWPLSKVLRLSLPLPREKRRGIACQVRARLPSFFVGERAGVRGPNAPCGFPRCASCES